MTNNNNNINKQIVQTETFKKYNHQKLVFGEEFFEVAICGYGNNLSEVQLFYQVIPRTKMIDDYDVNSKMSFEQVEDKPLFVKQALGAAKVMEMTLNKELSLLTKK
jgi:hypothetical protein